MGYLISFKSDLSFEVAGLPGTAELGGNFIYQSESPVNVRTPGGTVYLRGLDRVGTNASLMTCLQIPSSMYRILPSTLAQT